MSAAVVPIQRGRIRFDPKPAAFVLNKDPVSVAIASIRGGKTHAGAFKSIMHWLAHPTDVDEFHVIGSPTYPMSAAPKEKVFKLLYDKTIFPVCPLIRYRKGERIFELATAGGAITRAKLVTMSDPDKLRGFRWLSAWLDEGAYMAAYAWEVAQGRLLDSMGPAWITTTPKGYNWIFELYKRARAGDPRVRFFHWSAAEASHLSRQGIADLGRSYDARTAAQEMGALFVRDAGRVYYTFSASEHAVPARLNPGLELVVGIDFNVNPMTVLLMQPFKTREGLEGLHVIAEHYIDNGDTYKAATWLADFCAVNKVPKGKVKTYPDASGRSRHTSGGSDFEVLREAGFRVYAPPVNGPVGDRINVVNGLFKPMLLRFPRLLVDPSCVVLIEALEQQKRDKNGQPDKEHGHDHPVDALGYPCVYRYPLRQETKIAA